MRDLLVIVPSRGRPDVFKDFCKSFFQTSHGFADLLIGLDDDDVSYNIPDYGDRVLVETNPRLRLGGTLNLLASKYADKYRHLGFMGDDHRPRTIGWDQLYVEALDKIDNAGMVFGNDLIWGPGLPTQIAMHSDIVSRLGYMVPPGMIHMYLDNFWLELGKHLNTIQYLPDVVIEHLHPSAGKGVWTPQYEETNNPEVFNHDREKFEEYCENQMDKDVSKLLR